MATVIRTRAAAAPSINAAAAWSLAASASSVLPAAHQPITRYTPSSSTAPPPCSAGGETTLAVAALTTRRFARMLTSIDTAGAPGLHLFDGAVGAHPHHATHVRVVATDFNALQIARSVLHTVSTKRDPMMHADASVPMVYLTGCSSEGEDVLATSGREGIVATAALTAEKLKSVLASVAASSNVGLLHTASFDTAKQVLVLNANTQSATPMMWNQDATVSYAFRTTTEAPSSVTPAAIVVQSDAAGRNPMVAETKRHRALVLAAVVGDADWRTMADSNVKLVVAGKNVAIEKASTGKLSKVSAAVEKALVADLLAKRGAGVVNQIDLYSAGE